MSITQLNQYCKEHNKRIQLNHLSCGLVVCNGLLREEE